MNWFNSFQIVSLFVAMPYIITYLGTNPFPYSTALFLALHSSVRCHVPHGDCGG